MMRVKCPTARSGRRSSISGRSSSTSRRLGLDDDAIREIEQAIIEDPEVAAAMAGTGGLRKMRFAPSAWRTGKSGALRVGYAAFPDHGTVVLVVVFAKNERADLCQGTADPG
jgi:hypothetical protein